jgi:chemotaxis protein methyltransferase CheR
MLPTSQLEQLRRQVEAETGMDLGEARFPRFQAAVARLQGQHPGADFDRLLARAEDHAAILERLTAELTVGESFFFRNEHHFRALRERVFPDILVANAAKREIRIWSAGCATGEEPYSVAILLDQLLAGNGSWQVSILGTDLNLEFLERARQGRYRQWSFRQTDIQHNPCYFSTAGEWFVLSPKVRQHVRFAYLNLVKDVYPSPMTGTLGLDLILFRNVAIYLKPEVTKAIMERFQRALSPGGWLLIGEVELSLAHTAGLEARTFDCATFFQKPAGAPMEALLPGPFLMPPVPVVKTPGAAALPWVPALPQWGPLPWTGASPRAASAATPAVATLGEQVQRCLHLRDLAGAERALDRIAPARERAQNRLRYAQSLLGVAEIARARLMLEVCLREEPLLIEAHLLKASFAEEAGDLAAAEQSYRRALFLDRRCALAHFHLALVLQQRGIAAEARRSLATALKLTREKKPQMLVEYGEGICYGRLLEMVTLLTRDALGT